MLKPSLVRRAGVHVCFPALLLAIVTELAAQVPSPDERVRGLERQDGFIPFYWDEAEGLFLIEIGADRLDQDFLYLTSLATGIGSLPLGLDRGAIGDEAVVRFQRVGPKIFLVRQNTAYRALDTENAMLELSVEESFPTSVLAAFPIIAREDDRMLIDATDFFTRDAMGIAAELAEADQGKFSLDTERSAIYMPRTKAFPKNTEIEATVTLASDEPGLELRRHAPDGHSLTLRQHHSMVQLPPPYKPRKFDTRIGIFALQFRDFSSPLTRDYSRQQIIRWRLEKKDPEAAISEPEQPIVYYLDRGIPEPYRSAFRDGALWWNEVFEAAGFRNAFRVEDLPEGVDPMDARYSVIQWVHRTEPGFSIGPSFIDPRTGEILKAAVRMDSHRSLVDFNLWAGMEPAITADGSARRMYCDLPAAGTSLDWIAELDPNTDPVEFAMARRRQHAAHEVGHTLGLAHNFIASTYGRASVMDYPPPRVLISDGRIDLSEAYRPGPGAYDSLAIRYAYTEFSDADENEGLAGIVRDALSGGLLFITDTHARPAGASDPRANLWDDGTEAVAAFRHAMAVRSLLLERFNDSAIEPGEPMALLRDRLAPVYLHHRYALTAAIRTVGGMELSYTLRGDGQAPTRIIDPQRQRSALTALMSALETQELLISERVLQSLAPYPFGYAAPRRGFRSAAEPAFDQLGAARVLASMIVGGLLQRERTARLVAFAARQPNAVTLDEVIAGLVAQTWDRPPARAADAAALQRVTQRVVVDQLIQLAADDEATVEARAAAEWHLARLADQIGQRQSTSPEVQAHNALAARDVQRFLARVDNATQRSKPLEPPPGSPIGRN